MTPEEKFLKYFNHPELEVFYMSDRYHVSRNPFITHGIQECTSVPIVINAKGVLWGGATHNNDELHFSIYMPQYIDRILNLTHLSMDELADMSLATGVAGDETQHKQNMGYLREYGIHLAPYMRFEEFQGFIDFLFRGNIPGGEKKVLVIPELQEVIMYSKPVGYIQLI